MKAKRFTVEAGRLICCDGQPFITIGRAEVVPPAEADEVTHIIAALLNRLGSRTVVTGYLEEGHVSRLVQASEICTKCGWRHRKRDINGGRCTNCGTMICAER